MIVNMKMKSMRRVPKIPMDGAASSRVTKMSFNFFCFLIRRKQRPILSVRKIVPKIDTDSPTPDQFRIRITMVKNTTVKSN